MQKYSRRSLLAALWSIVGLLTISAFIIAFLFAFASRQYQNNEYGDNNYDRGANKMQGVGGVISVTSRAMVFAAIWTAVLSGIIVIYGTVILGVQSPTGKYYQCCSGNVHRLTPMSLGAFGGSLMMFANLTLVCAILFGEFEIRDFALNQNDSNNTGNVVDQTSFAFSIMCIFFTIMYASFAGLLFANSTTLLEESVADANEEKLKPSDEQIHNHAPGHIMGSSFGVRPKGTHNIEVL
ncbi:hypothetical protein ACHAWO_012979 [Cyclotella atomus]|uniref:Uncharacterized protein n=1 Tax=Cyclotella atomus TaxID=382360 RepID=A0ABD3PVK0_9STRA